MSPLTDKDFEQLNNWIRSGIVDVARASLNSEMSQEERDEVLGVALRQARGVSYLSPEGREAMSSLDGTAYLLWLGMRHHHEKLQPADVRRLLLLNISEVQSVLRVWEDLNLGESSQGLLAQVRKQVEARKPRKKKRTKS